MPGTALALNETDSAGAAIPVPAVDSMVIAAVRHGARARGNAAENRRNLRDKARLLQGFDHFRRLCLGDLREAWAEDRLHKTRGVKNRRLTWLALYRCYAAQQGLTRRLRIVALDRQGNYACQLFDPAPDDGWDTLVANAQTFGITEEDLMALMDARKKRAA